jgi:transposase-like protein
MAIIAHLGSTVKEYIETSRQKLAKLEIYCPDHIEILMKPHGQYERGIRGKDVKIQIQRLICPKCGKTVAVLPDFLRPYKQYDANEIESVLLEYDAKTPIYDIETNASVYTVRRWIKTVRPEAESKVAQLTAMAIEAGSQQLSVTKMSGLSIVEQIKSVAACLRKIKNCGNSLGLADMLIATKYSHSSSG